ncbi:MAG: tRNA (adenosine(37)-N6)-threonylcarbamoyltransferase complex dimerization subunit type 1 TsaB [Bdellovibrionia bacterium]
MKILAIETSTNTGSLALYCEQAGLLASRVSHESRSHSEKFNIFVDEVLTETHLKLSDIDAFAVGQGPGSFTGIRVGANIGKTFAFAFKRPLVAIDSLLNMASQFQETDLPVLSMINAHKNMVYLASYEKINGVWENKLAPAAYFVRELSQVIQAPHLVVGDGWQSYESYLPHNLKALLVRPEGEFFDYPTASALARLASLKLKSNETNDWKLFTPLYIRASEAEESKKGIKIQPLT